MDFSSGTNLLYGDNAQGKTNILESIYLAATTKSHRGSKDREMIQFHADEAHIRLQYQKQGIIHQLDMHLKKNRAKGAAIDRIPIRRSSDLLGQIPVIFFSPEDLKIIKNGKSAIIAAMSSVINCSIVLKPCRAINTMITARTTG